jgi:DNA-binding NtrC family response regulator
MARILLIDDESSMLSVLTVLLKGAGYDVVPALGGVKARELMKSESFDLMISDIRMNPINGMELLRQAHDERPNLPVIMLTAYGSVETAIEAMKLGAFDYVTKPFRVDELIITVKRALEYSSAISENVSLKAQLDTRYQLENIVAESHAMKNVCELIRKVAPTDATVLIYGESGTGKEIVAQAIHANSRRSKKTFLAVNCAALPEALLESEMFGHVKGAFTGASANKAGLFESAAGGTIFLDEIGSMPPSIQGKLLRVLQEKEVRRVGSNDHIAIDARVLAATNVRLESLLQEGKFREDLYYRLSVIPVEIKPLRERVEDIMPLVYHFLQRETKDGKRPTIDPDACDALESYGWPGNVRELENAVKHALAFISADVITKDVLPAKLVAFASSARHPGSEALEDGKGRSLRAFLAAKERQYLAQVLAASGGDKEKTAKALKISLATLYRKLPEESEK